jgi:diguanylate cyclase (GGDEF)-like protein/PAS domain S-box-containing protein
MWAWIAVDLVAHQKEDAGYAATSARAIIYAALGILATLSLLSSARRCGNRAEQPAALAAPNSEAAEKDPLKNSETEARLRKIARIFDQTSEGLMILDNKLRIIIANPALSHLTGYAEKELIDHLPDEFLTKQIDRQFIRTLISQMKMSGAWNCEVHILGKDGHEKPFLCRIACMPDKQASAKTWLIFLSPLSKIHSTEEHIKRLTITDPLTGLFNRSGFIEKLDENLANYSIDGLIVLNLNHMSRINDAYGHQAGDFLLQRVASHIRKVLRSQDVLGRLGDDNFGIQVVSSSLQHVELVAKKIMAAIAQPVTYKNQPLVCTAYAGVCMVSGSYEQAGELLRKADTAMRQARETGINAYHIFSENLSKTVIQRLQRETDLRVALDHGELALYYQPQTDIISGQICGCEALLRWMHPTQGLIPPLDFIPLAEETGLILPIGKWVLQEACRQNKAWQDAGFPPIVMAVNLSPLQLRHEQLTDDVADALSLSGLDPRWLELEVTESALIAEQMNTTLRALKEIGVGLSIDDFGTGYSSLAYLRHFPFNKLKIDRTFIQDMNSASGIAIVRMVLDMARELRIKTLAEGVETEEQMSILMDYQCEEYQGYLCSRPIPAADFIKLLQTASASAKKVKTS